MWAKRRSSPIPTKLKINPAARTQLIRQTTMLRFEALKSDPLNKLQLVIMAKLLEHAKYDKQAGKRWVTRYRVTKAPE
jgi:hypothetical protein